jgi:hypothetical protein
MIMMRRGRGFCVVRACMEGKKWNWNCGEDRGLFEWVDSNKGESVGMDQYILQSVDAHSKP